MKLNMMNIYFKVRNKNADHYFKHFDFIVKFENILLSCF